MRTAVVRAVATACLLAIAATGSLAETLVPVRMNVSGWHGRGGVVRLTYVKTDILSDYMVQLRNFVHDGHIAAVDIVGEGTTPDSLPPEAQSFINVTLEPPVVSIRNEFSVVFDSLEAVS